VTVFENDGMAIVQFKRGGSLSNTISANVTTVDGTAVG